MVDEPGPRLDQQFCFALYSTLHAVNRAYAPVLAALGLTYPQYLVMLVLWEADDLPVKAIGERVFLDSGTLTPLLKRLEAGGLVTRARDSKDERQVRVRLTDAGRQLKARAREAPDALLRAMGRDADEVKPLRKELRRIRNALLGVKDKPGKEGKEQKRAGKDAG
ncbi:MarR family winged helix-turn-helix transcriptional regulator [Methylocella sp.]|uniref:MarR family winged helix-turn-helix transcriptional regulator n=1 Tax=Methylocella sp. TaxID=1978226 RepID=UPI0035B044C1